MSTRQMTSDRMPMALYSNPPHQGTWMPATSLGVAWLHFTHAVLKQYSFLILILFWCFERDRLAMRSRLASNCSPGWPKILLPQPPSPGIQAHATHLAQNNTVFRQPKCLFAFGGMVPSISPPLSLLVSGPQGRYGLPCTLRCWIWSSLRSSRCEASSSIWAPDVSASDPCYRCFPF